MKQLIKQFFVYGLGSTIGKFISVFLLPIYSRVFSPEDYGNLDFIMTLSTIASVFGLLQIETGLQRFYYDYKEGEEQHKLVSTSLVFTFCVTLFITLILLAFSPLISNTCLGGEYTLELIVSFLIMIPTNVITILFVDFRFKNKAIIYMILNVFMVLAQALFSIVAVIIYDMGIIGIVSANTVVYTVVMIAAFIIWSKDGLYLNTDRKMLMEMLKFGFPQFPARLGSISNSYINRFFMIGMLSTYAIGIYSVSLKFASAMQLVQMAFQLAWLPYMYKILKEENHKETIIKLYKQVFLLISACVIIIALFSREIVMILTNEKYIESAKYAPILAFYFGLYLIKEVVDIGVNVTKKSKYTSYIYLLAALLNIILLYVLTPYFGLYGIVISLLLSNFALMYLTMLVSEKLYPMGFPKIWSLSLNIIVILVIVYTTMIDMSLIIKFITTTCLFGYLLYKFKDQLLSLAKQK